MAVAGVMEGCRQGDGFIGKVDAASRGHARGQEGKLAAVLPCADVDYAKAAITQE